MNVPMERPEPQPQEQEQPRRRRPYSRADHRARSHENAHASGGDHDADGAPDAHPRPHHPLVTHAPPDLITTDSGLAELLADLRAAGGFAYDSEFIGELTYFPKLCLIQTASPQRVALIDPLAEIDLRPFWELIADASVALVDHAGLGEPGIALNPVERATEDDLRDRGPDTGERGTGLVVAQLRIGLPDLHRLVEPAAEEIPAELADLREVETKQLVARGRPVERALTVVDEAVDRDAHRADQHGFKFVAPKRRTRVMVMFAIERSYGRCRRAS